VIPGTHNDDLARLRQRDDIDKVLGSEIEADVDHSKAVDLTLQSGDVEIHHPHIVHGSNANASPHRRCGLRIRYIPTSTRIVSEKQPFRARCCCAVGLA
jgi:phytanoyl-CoA hydroxylase